MPSVPTATTMGASPAGSVKPALLPCRWTGHRCHSWSTVGTVRVWVRTGLPPAPVAELEITVGEGPGFDAFNSGRPVLVADIEGEERGHWPAFADGVAALDTRAIFAFPLQLGGRSFRRDHPHTAYPGAAAGRRSGAGSQSVRCDRFVTTWYRRGTGRRLRCRLAQGDDVDTRTTSSYGYGHVQARGRCGGSLRTVTCLRLRPGVAPIGGGQTGRYASCGFHPGGLMTSSTGQVPCKLGVVPSKDEAQVGARYGS